MSNLNATEFILWEIKGKTFAIRKATPSDADQIIEVAKSAFYDPHKPERWYYRSEASRENYARNDYPRRVVQSDT